MPSPRLFASLLPVVLMMVGCIDLPEIDSSAEPPSSADLTVKLASPSEKTFTNDAVSIEVQITGGTPDKVELRVDDQVLTTLEAPYTYQWSTKSTPEGPHRLTAHASLGDKTFASEPREVIVDRTPPEVISRTPAPGAQNVRLQQPIQVTFSERIKASSLTPAAVHLTTTSAEIPVALTLSADETTVKVSPSNQPTAPNTPTVTLTSQITDLAGNGLSLPADSWTWDVPAWLFMGIASQDPNHAPYSLSVHSDSHGNLLVSSLTGETAHISRWSGTSGWKPLESESGTPLAGSASRLAISTDTEDGLLVAWSHHQSNSGVQLGYWTEQGGWQVPPYARVAAPSDRGDIRLADLQCTATNAPLLLWASAGPYSGEGAFFLSVSQGPPLKDWSESTVTIQQEQLNPDGYDGLNTATLQLLSSGAPVVAWADFNNSIRVTYWNTVAQSWQDLGQGMRVDSTNGYASDPTIRIDKADNIYLAWREAGGGTGSTYNIYARRWDGGAWQPMGSALSAYTGNTPTSAPNLVIDSLDRPILTWTEFGGDPQYVHIRIWDGSQWQPFGPRLNGTEGYAPVDTRPATTLDPSGNLIVAWGESTTGKVFVYKQNN